MPQATRLLLVFNTAPLIFTLTFSKLKDKTTIPDGSMTTTPTHYEVLTLPRNLQFSTIIPAQTLRNAYRRALLQNHPDKTSLNTSSSTSKRGAKYTVDQVSTAFNVLGNQKLRAEYDKELKAQDGGVNRGIKDSGFRTGVEVVDLDDLEFQERQEEEVWYRSCRCGEERGFEVREVDLEDASAEGEAEVCVGCKGCSLWLRVQFGVVVEDNLARAME